MTQAPSMDMVVVRDYVNACAEKGWRPVFTKAQMRSLWDQYALGGEFLDEWLDPDRAITIFGVRVTLDDSPRPPMPAELMVRA